MREFEEIDISSKAVEVTVNNKGETLKTFVWISSKNSASGLAEEGIASSQIFSEILYGAIGSALPGVDLRFSPWLLLFKY